jgi:pimeloyl-ACP methyl ester carboxylesterase
MQDEMLTLTNGRTLALRHAGGHGPVVVYLHGSPMSRLDVDTFEVEGRARDVSVVGMDRPGCGASTFMPFTFASVADDVAAVADHLGTDRVQIIGHSSGACYALAAAAFRPDRVGSVVAAGVVPPYLPDQEWWSMLSDGEQRGVRLIGVDDVEAERLLADADRDYMDLLDDDAGLIRRWWEDSGPADRRVLDAGLGALIVRSTRESLRQGQKGWARDSIVRMGPWAFDLADIRVPVTLVHGDQDYGPGLEWIAERIPDVRVEVVADRGHLFVLAEPEVALDALDL